MTDKVFTVSWKSFLQFSQCVGMSIPLIKKGSRESKMPVYQLSYFLNYRISREKFEPEPGFEPPDF